MVLTPQLKQSIELLQLPTADLLETISRTLEENPFLELPEDSSGEDSPLRGSPESEAQAPRHEEESDSAASAPLNDMPPEVDLVHQPWGMPEGDDEYSPIDRAVSLTTLADHLQEELGLLRLDPDISAKASFLIGELDDDGFLPISLEEAAKDFERITSTKPAEPEQWQEALRVLRGLDPIGVGASSPQESLLLQLESRIQSCPPEERKIHELAKKAIAEHLQELARKDFSRLKKCLGCSDEEVRGLYGCIQSLTPRPAALYKSSPTLYVIPDVFVRRQAGRWEALLNPATVPPVRINERLVRLMSAQENGRSKEMSGCLTAARTFAHSVNQRFETILKVAQAIVRRQQDFFSRGELALTPMVLRDIAEDTQLHESTVSRAVNGKYLQSSRGVYEFRHFFSSHVSNASGQAVSSKAIRTLIREFVEGEPPDRPLSDSQLAALLVGKGFAVARRTVAKYREQEQIPIASLRKKIPL